MKAPLTLGLLTQNKTHLATLLLFTAVLALHFYHALIGWDLYISGPQDFRQAQTAIATYYIAEEGPALAYKVPVLGPEWRIPFEFPTYQSITALFATVTNTGLDQSGRAVSLAAFYLALIPLYLVLLRVKLTRPEALAIIALVLTSATYIFWSRVFLIESTVWLLALWYAYFCLRWRDDPRALTFAIAIALGGLTAVTKFTTFSIVFGFIITFHVIRSIAADDRTAEERSIFSKQNALLLVMLLAPLLPAMLWNNYIFGIWAQSPLQETASENIHRWNFGAWTLRFDSDFWGRFYLHAFERTKLTFIPAVLGLGAFGLASKRYRIIALSTLVAWISGPLIWANLFYVHDYYYYATHFLLLTWLAASIFGALETLRWPKWTGYALIALIAGLQVFEYRQSNYYEAQLHNWGGDRVELGLKLNETTEPNEVLLIIGDDWNPLFSYYSERYSIMYRWLDFDADGKFQEAVDLMGVEGRHFGAAIVRDDEEFIAEFNQLALRANFKAEPESIRADEFIYFLAIEKIQDSEKSTYP